MTTEQENQSARDTRTLPTEPPLGISPKSFAFMLPLEQLSTPPLVDNKPVISEKMFAVLKDLIIWGATLNTVPLEVNNWDIRVKQVSDALEDLARTTDASEDAIKAIRNFLTENARSVRRVHPGETRIITATELAKRRELSRRHQLDKANDRKRGERASGKYNGHTLNWYWNKGTTQWYIGTVPPKIPRQRRDDFISPRDTETKLPEENILIDTEQLQQRIKEIAREYPQNRIYIGDLTVQDAVLILTREVPPPISSPYDTDYYTKESKKALVEEVIGIDATRKNFRVPSGSNRVSQAIVRGKLHEIKHPHIPNVKIERIEAYDISTLPYQGELKELIIMLRFQENFTTEKMAELLQLPQSYLDILLEEINQSFTAVSQAKEKSV